MGVVLVVGVIAYFPYKSFSDRGARASAPGPGEASETAGDVDLALRHMETYVRTWPEDLPGLEYQAKLLADTARTPRSFLPAAQRTTRSSGATPTAREPGRPPARDPPLRPVRGLHPRLRGGPQGGRGGQSQLRYRTAEKVARQARRPGRQGRRGAASWLALEGIVVSGDRKALDQDDRRLPRDPQAGADRHPVRRAPGRAPVAFKQDRAGAEATMDALLRADPKSVAARMARYRFFVRQKDDAKAKDEMRAASEMAPLDPTIQTAAATDAMQRRDFAEARRHLDAIPATRPTSSASGPSRGCSSSTRSTPTRRSRSGARGSSPCPAPTWS